MDNSKIKIIAVITPIQREFDIYSRDNASENIRFVHVFRDNHIEGVRFNSIIKLYRWFDIKNVEEIIYNINRRII